MKHTLGGLYRKAGRLVIRNKVLFVPDVILGAVGIGYALFVLRSLGGQFSTGLLADGGNANNSLSGGYTIVSLLWGFASLLVIAGKANMFATSAREGTPGWNEFAHGVRRYSGRIMIGILMFIGLSLLLSPLWLALLAVMNRLGVIGFLLLPVLCIPLLMWVVVLVSDDCGLGQALKRSIRFTLDNFLYLLLIIVSEALINSIFSSSMRFGSMYNFSWGGIGLFRGLSWQVSMVLSSIVQVLTGVYFWQLRFVLYIEKAVFANSARIHT